MKESDKTDQIMQELKTTLDMLPSFTEEQQRYNDAILKTKKFQIKTLRDIFENLQRFHEEASASYAYGKIEDKWKDRGEIWWYYDIQPLSGTAGLILVKDGKILDRYVTIRA